jgi:Zn finger protein HypA/HybF involved in hydrogenase expression
MEDLLRQILEDSRWCPKCKTIYGKLHTATACPECQHEIFNYEKLWDLYKKVCVHAREDEERLARLNRSWVEVCQSLDLNTATTTPGLLMHKIREKADLAKKEFFDKSKSVAALKDYKRRWIDVCHALGVEGARTSSATLVNLIRAEGVKTKQDRRLNVVAVDRSDQVIYSLELPVCPECSSVTMKVITGEVEQIRCSECDWCAPLMTRSVKSKSVSHELKTWPVPFQAVVDGEKTMEIRKDDRSPKFAVGHTLCLREYRPTEKLGDKSHPRATGFTGRSIYVRVTGVYRGESAVPEGYVLMSIEPQTGKVEER